MFARPRPAPFAVSLLTHGSMLAWLASAPMREEPKSLYAQAIAPHSSKLVWYDFRQKLPDVSPTAARKPARPPRVDAISSHEVVSAAAKARSAGQLVWQPVPKLELHTELQSPNVVAIHAERPAPPPKPKLFVPPPAARAPTGDAPMLAAPPEIRTARNVNGAAKLPGMQPANAPPRAFVAPAAPPVLRTGAKPSPFGFPLPEPPALPESPPSAAVSMAIVGLNPNANAPPPTPEGARNAQFSAGPQLRRIGETDGSVDAAVLTVPGLLIRSQVPDGKPTLMARPSPTSAANLRAALRGSLPTSIAGPHSAAIRVSSAPDPEWSGRAIFAMSVQMPNVSSYTGSWMIWFAERQEEFAVSGVLTPPVPLHKVDPKYFPAAMADRVEGKVRLAAVIRKDGRVVSVRLLQHLDDRLDQSARDAVDKWQFEPALRNGEPVDVDALIEIPFRLAPKVPK